MAYDFRVLKDGVLTVKIKDHETGEVLFAGTRKVEKGQKISYEIYSEEEGVLEER